jgi:hypothetical protein
MFSVKEKLNLDKFHVPDAVYSRVEKAGVSTGWLRVRGM